MTDELIDLIHFADKMLEACERIDVTRPVDILRDRTIPVTFASLYDVAEAINYYRLARAKVDIPEQTSGVGNDK